MSDENRTSMQRPLNILVVEDNEVHRAAAQELLKGHNLTVASDLEDALTALGGHPRQESMIPYESVRKYDALLTDLMFPQGGKGCLLSDPSLAKEPAALGYPLALLAANSGATKRIAIVTDISHHSNPIARTFDLFKDGGKCNSLNKECKNKGHKRYDCPERVIPISIDGAVCKLFDIRNLRELYLIGKEYVLYDDSDGFRERYNNYVKEHGSDSVRQVKNWKAALEQLLLENTVELK